MTLEDAKQSLVDLRDSKAWNYILIGTAVLTLIVAARNIWIYSSEIAKLSDSTDGS
jgi:hypothetical protein